jgi:hypothetical protein
VVDFSCRLNNGFLFTVGDIDTGEKYINLEFLRFSGKGVGDCLLSKSGNSYCL